LERSEEMRTATVLLIVLLAVGVATAFEGEKEKAFVQPVPGSFQLLDCSDAIPIYCGVPVTGNTYTNPNNVEYYSCVGWQEAGGEVVYELVLDDCYILTMTLSNYTGDPDVFLLGSCDENDCIEYAHISVTTECLDPGTYYVVVDGYYSSPDCDYTLTIDCVECDCPVPPCCPFEDVCCWLDFNVEHCNLIFMPCGGEPVWEWGVPVGIPDVGCDDVVITKVLGTVLADHYPPSAGEIAMIGPYMITEECWCMELCHFYDTEAYFDGGNVKVSTDAGATWELITPARGYDELETYSGNACIPGEPAFSGHQFNDTFLRDCFDLRDYIGQDVWFGFFFGSDSSIQYPGWYLKWIKTGGGYMNPVEDTSWGAIKAMYR
jgi:hypothetical protein